MIEERELGWGETIDTPDEGEYTVFPDGIYPFFITDVNRGRHAGSDKLSPCPMATITLEIDGGPKLGKTTYKHKLFLHTKVTGLLCQFFRGIGLRKHKEPLVLDVNPAKGRPGFVKLGSRSWVNDKGDTIVSQDIKKFIYPEDWPPMSSVAQPQSVAPAPVQQPAQPAQPVQPAQYTIPANQQPLQQPAQPAQPWQAVQAPDESPPF